MKINITKKLCEKLVELKLVEANDSDDQIKAAAASAMLSGEISPEEMKSLLVSEEESAASEFMAKMNQLFDSISKNNQPNAEVSEEKNAPANVEAEEGQVPAWGEKSINHLMSRFGTEAGDASKRTGWMNARVKGVEEKFDTTKQAAKFPSSVKGIPHPHAGKNAFEYTDGGIREIEGTSQLDKAVMGAYLRYQANAQMKSVPAALRLTDTDHELMNYALNEMKWGGVLAGDCESVGTAVRNRKLTEMERKTVIDDVGTGGLEVAPIAFDDAVITIPILFGQLAPFVNTVPITRGRRIESATLGNMSLTSAGSVVDDTPIPLFATAGFIAAFDTTIHVVHGSIEIGLDFMSDALVDLASHVTQKYGELLLAWMDEQIAIGDGVNEPEGIMVAAGTTAVAAGGAAPTVSLYEQFLFGVPLRYKQGFDSSRIRYAANETTYRRARGIAVGATDDRRVFGMNEEQYAVFGHGYSIVDTMANTQAFFANLARYRLYRRLGLTLRIVTEGRELALRNKMLITCRARMGGALEDGLAAAVSTTMQA